VTHLRKIMLEELQRRHYSEGTTRNYIRKVEAFARYFQCSPDRLGPQHIREYQAYLFTKRKLSPGSVTNHLCALRFFYIQTLKKPWSIAVGCQTLAGGRPSRYQNPCQRVTDYSIRFTQWRC